MGAVRRHFIGLTPKIQYMLLISSESTKLTDGDIMGCKKSIVNEPFELYWANTANPIFMYTQAKGRTNSDTPIVEMNQHMSWNYLLPKC